MAESLNLRPSERRLLVGVALVLFVVVNIWFVWPKFGELKKVKRERAAALAELDVFNEEIAKTDDREAEVRRLESIGSNKAGQHQAIQLLLTVQRKASGHGVNITGNSRPGTRTNEFFIEQSQNVTAISDEAELVEFLYALGSSNSTIRVRDLTIRPDAKRYNLSSNIKLVSSYRVKTPAGRKKSAPTTTAKK